MARNWTTATVDELKASSDGAIAIGPFGSRMKANLYTPSGVPVIRGNNLGRSKQLQGEFVFVSGETADSMRNCNVFGGDLVFPHRGAIGEVGIIPSDGNRYMLSTSLMKLTCNREKVLPEFLYYFFKSAEGRHELLKNASTVGTPGIGQPLTSLRSIRVPLPPRPQQERIADILGTLDDKIELNRRMNETLEAMARRLFKSWFIDFDPVLAKAALRRQHPKLSNAELSRRALPNMATEIAELFPDSFADSTLRLIPKGWTVEPFADTVQILGGGTPKTSNLEFWGGEIPWFSVVDAPSDSDVFVINTQKTVTHSGIENSSATVLPCGTTIISARGTVGRVALVGNPMAMNQSCYALRGRDDRHGYFTYYSTRSLVAVLKQRSHGSVFDTITRDTLMGVNVVTPARSIVAAYEMRIHPQLERIRMNLHQSTTLKTMRDRLLPRLLSGELLT